MRISAGASSSLALQRAFIENERDTAQALKELASGSRFADAGADPAGRAIADQLSAQARGSAAALRNTEVATSLPEIAEGAMSEQSNILIRLRELAVQAASDTVSDDERGYLNNEFTQLTQEVDQIAKTTTYGSQHLLDGSSKTYEFQVGLHSGEDNVISYEQDSNTTSSSLGIRGLGVADKSDARDALDSLDAALKMVAGQQAKAGALANRFNFAVSNLQSQTDNLSEAASKVGDANIPDAVSRLRRGQVAAQYQTEALRSANEVGQSALRLIG